MAEVETFFRFCPSCGKRFHIRLLSKKLVDSKRETFDQKRVVTGGNPNPMSYGRAGGMASYPLTLEVNVPITVYVEDFQFSYKCKHCGHEWTENRVERHNVG
jgi:DNA-directed RNA polymerase subunit RPC12/RpoP